MQKFSSLLGLGNACISHVSKNEAKGSELFDPRVGRGRKLAGKRVFSWPVHDASTPGQLPSGESEDGLRVGSEWWDYVCSTG